MMPAFSFQCNTFMLLMGTIGVMQCGKPFQRDDIITLNGTDDEITELRTRMDARRLSAKMEKVSTHV